MYNGLLLFLNISIDFSVSRNGPKGHASPPWFVKYSHEQGGNSNLDCVLRSTVVAMSDRGWGGGRGASDDITTIFHLLPPPTWAKGVLTKTFFNAFFGIPMTFSP